MTGGLHWVDSHFGGEGGLHWVDSHFGGTVTEFGKEDYDGIGGTIFSGDGLELDCDPLAHCGSPGHNPWGDVGIAGDVTFGADTLVARVRNWWTGRTAVANALAQHAAVQAAHTARSAHQQATMPAINAGDSVMNALIYAEANDPYALGE